MIWSTVLLIVVNAERIGELWLARRNTQLLLNRGAVEVAGAHYPLIVALHTVWLIGLWYLAWNTPVHFGWFLAFAVLQVLRFWTLSTLGKRWTTRILVVPGENLVSSGPYRYLRHPNYMVVIGEIAVLPLCFGLPLYALIFSVVNAQGGERGAHQEQ